MSRHPLPEQRTNTEHWRNCGLGVFGYATMLMKMGLKYGDYKAIELTDGIFDVMLHHAVEQSTYLGNRFGNFPGYDPKIWDADIIQNNFDSAYIEVYKSRNFLRNCSLLSIAPTGSIATMLGESGGIEPEFAISYTRRTVGLTDNNDHYYTVYCKAAKEYMALHPEITSADQLPDYFVASADIDPMDRVKTQAIIQNYIDTAISSTVNLPEEATEEQMAKIYIAAWEQGLKGLTIFRSGCKRQAILTTDNKNDKEQNVVKADNTTSESVLKRGDIINCTDDLIGKKRKITTGCGSMHVLAFFDPVTGDMLEVYLNKGSTGGCANFTTGLSRTISLLCRAGVSVYDIKDQLDSTGVCPSYAIRTATKHDTSKGSCCPMAVGNVLVEMWEEMQSDLDTDDTEGDYESSEITLGVPAKPVSDATTATDNVKRCPECGEPLVATGGCFSCFNCSYTKCE